MALANITIFIAQAAALVILIFALISYIVYKVRSRKANNEWQAHSTPVVTSNYNSDFEITFHDSHYTDLNPAPAPVFTRVKTNPGFHQRATSDDLLSKRVAQARDSRPKVVKSSYERPKEKIQMVQNWT